MDLLVDIGNTNLKWAIQDSGGLEEMRVLRHHGGLPIDLHAAWELLPAPGRILVASVASHAISDALALACRYHWDKEPELVHTEPCRRGVTVAYPEPERLGVDRWVALIAAHQLVEGPVLVVDAGTAITLDLMHADGRHLGGLILPGVDMMRRSLLSGTQIHGVEGEEDWQEWAIDTAGAVNNGSLLAPAALAERLMRRLEDESGERATLLLTGGDATRLLPAFTLPYRHEPALLLQGLSLLLA